MTLHAAVVVESVELICGNGYSNEKVVQTNCSTLNFLIYEENLIFFFIVPWYKVGLILRSDAGMV
jgi:hypothetical protein